MTKPDDASSRITPRDMKERLSRTIESAAWRRAHGYNDLEEDHRACLAAQAPVLGDLAAQMRGIPDDHPTLAFLAVAWESARAEGSLLWLEERGVDGFILRGGPRVAETFLTELKRLYELALRWAIIEREREAA
jgi:hypothetical protein